VGRSARQLVTTRRQSVGTSQNESKEPSSGERRQTRTDDCPNHLVIPRMERNAPRTHQGLNSRGKTSPSYPLVRKPCFYRDSDKRSKTYRTCVLWTNFTPSSRKMLRRCTLLSAGTLLHALERRSATPLRRHGPCERVINHCGSPILRDSRGGCEGGKMERDRSTLAASESPEVSFSMAGE